MTRLLAISALALAAAMPASAKAADLDFDLGLVSDYRDRGLSLSRSRPALQAEARLRHGSGAYASVFASQVRGDGATMEVQFGGGIERSLGFATLDLSMAAMIYPGTRGLDMVEMGARLSRPLGAAEAGFSLLYAPPQRSLGGKDNLYAAFDASLPLGSSPLSLSGSAGVERGAAGTNKLDWSLGLAADLGGSELAVSLTDSNRSAPALVLAKRFAF